METTTHRSGMRQNRPRLSAAQVQGLLDDPGLGKVRVRYAIPIDRGKLVRMRTDPHLHMSQAELATAAGVSLQTVTKLERALRPASFQTVQKLCAFFGCKAADLMPDEAAAA